MLAGQETAMQFGISVYGSGKHYAWPASLELLS